MARSHALVTHNGQVVRLAPGAPGVIGEVETGRLVVDGKSLLPMGGEALKNRQRMVWNGAAMATVVVDRNGKLRAPPQVTVQGLAEDPEAAAEELRDGVEEAIEKLSQRASAATTMPCAMRCVSRSAVCSRRGMASVRSPKFTWCGFRAAPLRHASGALVVVARRR